MICFRGILTHDNHKDSDTDKENADKSGHNYRRYLIDHFWKLYRNSFAHNESKAKALAWGQLGVFVGLMLLVAAQMVAMIRFAGMSNESKSANSNPQTVSGTVTSTRPEPLQASSSGTLVRDGVSRPSPQNAASAGQSVRLNNGERPAPTQPSTDGLKFRNDNGSGN